MKQNMKALLFSSLALTVTLAACNQKPSLISDRPQMGSSVGIQSADVQARQIVQKVRLRDQDGKKVLEYLDPTAGEEKWVSLGQIETRPAGTQFYHWGPSTDVKYWTTQGISHEDIDRSVRNYDATDAYGGGFYASLSPTDSSGYGESLVVIRPKEEVVTLDLTHVGASYNRDQMGLEFFGDNRVIIPVALIADAGVHTMRYTDTWMVCISGRPLENLLEGSWDVFISQNEIAKMNFATILTLATKYPLTPEVYTRPDFQKAFPTVAKFYKHQSLSDDDYSEVMNAIELDANILTSLKNSEQWKGFYAEIQLRLKARYLKKLNEALAINDFSSVENSILPALGKINLKIEDLVSGQKSLAAVPAGSVNFTGAMSFKTSTEIMTLLNELSMFDFYQALSLALKGEKNVKMIMGLKPDEQTFAEKKMSGVSMGVGSLENTLGGLAKLWGQNKLILRDRPLMATGPNFLDGVDQPGYIRITQAEKNELLENPFIVPTFKEMTNENGAKDYFVRYEYPVAKHYKRMLKYIKNPELLSRLELAEKNGDLEATDLSRSAVLTQDLLREISQNRLEENSNAIIKNFVDLMRIQPFADTAMGEKLLFAYVSVQRFLMPFSVDPGVFKTATYLEVVQNAIDSNSIKMAFYKTLDRDWSEQKRGYLDPQNDFGVWEIASNNYGPHKDPAQFLAKVKARFESEEVQGWLQAKAYDRIQQALHEAAENQ